MQLAVNDPKESFFGRWRWLAIAALVLLVAGGLAIRFSDLSNPPLDQHAWRQLRSASIARGLYYDMLPNVEGDLRATAHYLSVTFATLEPTIFEHIVAYTYFAIGTENIVVARVWAIVFWCLGGAALYLLARRLSGIDGALAGLAYFIFLPFAVSHSRAFLPELPMIACMLWTAYSAYRWIEAPTWPRAVATGVLAGVTILIKVFAVFPVVASIGLLLLTSWGLRRILRSPQFWLALGLAAAIPAVYYFIGMPGGAGNYLSVWTLPYLHLLKDVYFYVRWLQKLHSLFNLTFLVAGVVGLALLPKPGRALVSGLWIGYVITGLMVPSLIRSHSYYNLQLVPTVALSLGPLAQVVFKRLAKISIPWQAIMIAALLVGLGDAVIWDHKEISTVDYRSEPAFWKDLGSKLPGGRLIGLSEDYNTRIQYYGWRFVAQYPYSYDQTMDREAGGSFDVNADNWSYFLERTNGYDYFLVTVLDEFDAQPYLKKILYGYYPIVMQGDRYVLFDLRHPIKPIPSGG